jgi:hypothetical protein
MSDMSIAVVVLLVPSAAETPQLVGSDWQRLTLPHPRFGVFLNNEGVIASI